MTDGERVVFFFGNGDLVSHSLDGKEQWRRKFRKITVIFALEGLFPRHRHCMKEDCTSSCCSETKRFMNGKPDSPSYLLCMDPSTGKPFGVTTGLPRLRKLSRVVWNDYSHEGELIVAGGDELTGHDPSTGKKFGVGALGIRTINKSGGDKFPAGRRIGSCSSMRLQRKRLFLPQSLDCRDLMKAKAVSLGYF